MYCYIEINTLKYIKWNQKLKTEYRNSVEMTDILVRSSVDGIIFLYIPYMHLKRIFQLPVYLMSDCNHLLAYDSHSAFKGSLGL